MGNEHSLLGTFLELLAPKLEQKVAELAVANALEGSAVKSMAPPWLCAPFSAAPMGRLRWRFNPPLSPLPPLPPLPLPLQLQMPLPPPLPLLPPPPAMSTALLLPPALDGPALAPCMSRSCIAPCVASPSTIVRLSSAKRAWRTRRKTCCFGCERPSRNGSVRPCAALQTHAMHSSTAPSHWTHCNRGPTMATPQLSHCTGTPTMRKCSSFASLCSRRSRPTSPSALPSPPAAERRSAL
mmetsp:Transcript_1982/g.3222  ORF Transcript_1982/g.3222 Transcript_1982/m.3222 type:complete len:239 (-) Transcript_1982:489-1205(-)